MPTGIRSTFSRLAADGRIGKGDVEKIVREALDGKGVTKTEATQLKRLREKHADVFTKKGGEAFDNFLSKMGRSWSRTKKVHLPNIEDGEVKRLLTEDPRIGIYTGRSRGSGGEASTTRSSGGEASTTRSRGGETTTRRQPTRRSSGSEVSTRRSSGGESSSRSSYSSRSSWGGGYSRSYGGE